jgi:aminopeptidase N
MLIAVLVVACSDEATPAEEVVPPTATVADVVEDSAETVPDPTPTTPMVEEGEVDSAEPIPLDGPTTVLHPENLSAGDPYAPELGNLGYDVAHYDLQLTLTPAFPFIQGTTTIDAVTTQSGLSQLSFDFVGFEGEDVTVNGMPVSSFRDGNKLIVNLPETVLADTELQIAIAYEGQPVNEPSIYAPFAENIGMTFREGSIFVLSEPDGSRYWFPNNDTPRDKATFSFDVTVPEGMSAAVNGVLVEKESGVANAFGDGSSGDRFVWEHDFPMATYLATVNVAEYDVFEGALSNGVATRDYIFPSYLDRYNQTIGFVDEQMTWIEDLLGPYPFETYGHAAIDQSGAALETQTMVVMPAWGFREDVLMHELAHMWMGNAVSLDSWADMWRNEGFATYFTELWLARGDAEELELSIDAMRQEIEDSPSGYPLNAPPPAELFGRDSYIKGAVVVHDLRQTMGDDAFFSGLRTYLERFDGGTATHEQFQNVMEEASGVDLDAFFAEAFQ